MYLCEVPFKIKIELLAGASHRATKRAITLPTVDLLRYALREMFGHQHFILQRTALESYGKCNMPLDNGCQFLLHIRLSRGKYLESFKISDAQIAHWTN